MPWHLQFLFKISSCRLSLGVIVISMVNTDGICTTCWQARIYWHGVAHIFVDDMVSFNIHWQVTAWDVFRIQYQCQAILINWPWSEVHGQVAFGVSLWFVQMSLSHSHCISYPSWLIAGRTLSYWHHVCLEAEFCMFTISISWLPSTRIIVLNMSSFGRRDKEMSVMSWVIDRWEIGSSVLLHSWIS